MQSCRHRFLLVVVDDLNVMGIAVVVNEAFVESTLLGVEPTEALRLEG